MHSRTEILQKDICIPGHTPLTPLRTRLLSMRGAMYWRHASAFRSHPGRALTPSPHWVPCRLGWPTVANLQAKQAMGLRLGR